MIITRPPTIKCKKCGKVHKFDVENFGEPETVSDERNMGYEIQYVWETAINCSKCQNLMAVTIEGWEYPVGVYNYDEFTAEGCLFIEKPELEIVFNDSYEEES